MPTHHTRSSAHGNGRKQARPADPRGKGKHPPFDETPQDRAPAAEHAMRERPDFGEDSYVGHQRLLDRVALVTGGDSGIGRAVVLAFAREGADVAIAFERSEGKDAELSAKLVRDAGRRALLLPCDLAEPKDCAMIVERTTKELGQIDIVVNNAAHQGKVVERFEALDEERVRRTFAVNVESMFHVLRAALPRMKPGGVIINTASVQAYQPSAQILDYAATKGAIVTFTKGLAEELVGRGMRANVVAPGPVWTPLIAQSSSAAQLQKFGANNPMGRPAQPAEIAPAFVFLASDESRFVNGEVLGVTGGKLLA